MTQYLKWILSALKPTKKGSEDMIARELKEKIVDLDERLKVAETTNADLVVCVQQLASALTSVAYQVSSIQGGDSVDDALDKLMNSDDPGGSGYLH